MTTMVWVGAAVCVLIAHEVLASRGGARGAGIVRRVLLGVLLAIAVVIGPALVARVGSAWEQATAPEHVFVETGDPLRLRALASQRPALPFPVGASPEATAAWQRQITLQLASRMHMDSGRGAAADPVAVTRAESRVVDGITRTLITFTSWDGTPIPAYVLDPGGASRRRAVLVVPGHGHGIASTAGLTESYEHQAALALARRGFVTLTPELRGFGRLSPTAAATHRLVAAAALAEGTSYKAIVGHDLSFALSVLQQWPGVDPERLAVTGTSLGGELAVMIAALDPRVRVVVSNSYGGVTGPATEDDQLDDDSRQTPHGCHTIPGVNEILLQEDWARLIAPRPLLVVRGDGNVPSRIDDFERMASQAYAALAAVDRFDVAIEPGGHEFYIEPTVRFIARWL